MSMDKFVEELAQIISRIERPKKALITAGMPYANGPLHIGHLAGTIVPADIYARWMKLVVGEENTLFVFGTDDHGSNSEVSAKKEGKTTRAFIDEVHERQSDTLQRFQINSDIYSGTSKPGLFDIHTDFCQTKLRELFKNGMLEKKVTKQWYDTREKMFLPDRFVTGRCPNPECGNLKAYSSECDSCGYTYEPEKLINPCSAISGTEPELRDTEHFWLNMWNVVDQLKNWINSKSRVWRKPLIKESIDTVTPRLVFSNIFENSYKELKDSLPKHKSRYAAGKKIVCLFESVEDLTLTFDALIKAGADPELDNSWALRSITRDIPWGIPVPSDIDEAMEGKTLYVWPDSLYAPIAFSRKALELKGRPADEYKKYWMDPESKVFQFLGQDNNFFYVVMQGALWFGSQKEINRLPLEGELQLTDIFSCFHLQIEGQKMSKSTGNFVTGDELILEKGFSSDQLRYFFALLSITEKPSNFEFDTLTKRNEFLAGPMNAAFEKPLSAAKKHYDCKVPDGDLIGKTEKETKKIIQIYLNGMKKAEYSKLLFAIENYARVINGLFNQYKPHDDRFPEKERKDALYSSFYILKNIVIMLSPFVPATMEKLRESLNLPRSIYSLDELAIPIAKGHKVGEKQIFFPMIEN